jgi:hypothetical protein
MTPGLPARLVVIDPHPFRPVSRFLIARCVRLYRDGFGHGGIRRARFEIYGNRSRGSGVFPPRGELR